jgi:GcrA cell cycle regulator
MAWPWQWTPERVARMKFLWLDGKSASEVAREIGATRNMVIGKVHRMGLHKQRPERLTVEAIQRGAVNRETVLRALKLKPEPLPPEDARPLPKSRPTILTELGPDHCRWPLGDPKDEGFHFCGAPIAQRKKGGRVQRPSYCQVHAELSVRPTDTRDRPPRPEREFTIYVGREKLSGRLTLSLFDSWKGKL